VKEDKKPEEKPAAKPEAKEEKKPKEKKKRKRDLNPLNWIRYGATRLATGVIGTASLI
jgi:outer membrane biosynthesis protein TonB